MHNPRVLSMAPTPMCLLTLVVALMFLLLEGPAAAAPVTTERQREVQSLLKRLNKPPVATIESPDGDIIDCVHISKQPAFDHPLLKNHTIQMQPSYYPKGLSRDSHPITQTWQQNGKCPENTIPIRRTKEEDVLRASSIERYGKKTPGTIPNINSMNGSTTPDVTSGHQYGVASASVGKGYGTKASFNLWKPTIGQAGVFSLTQTWIVAGSYNNNDLNTIETGWQVYPGLYGDNNPRLFIYWTSDAYQHTGCYNLGCSGFVQTNNQITIGGTLSPVSTYGGTQYDFDILVFKDKPSGNWYLQVLGTLVGYWPSSIFSHLSDSASTIQWGGEVASDGSGQTSTQMGSGHFPSEGYGKASHIKNIEVVDSSNTLNPASGLGLIAPQPKCYNVQNGNSGTNFGTYIYYGGPGKNANCQ